MGQRNTDTKSHEITAIPELLQWLAIPGCIVTMDAMGCQKKIAKEIIEADADYVLALKGNQETVHAEVKSFLDAMLLERQAPRPVGAKLCAEAASLATLEVVEKAMVDWKCAATTRAIGWVGLPTVPNGKVCSP